MTPIMTIFRTITSLAIKAKIVKMAVMDNHRRVKYGHKYEWLVVVVCSHFYVKPNFVNVRLC